MISNVSCEFDLKTDINLFLFENIYYKLFGAVRFKYATMHHMETKYICSLIFFLFKIYKD